MKKPFERFTAALCLAGAALVGYWAWRYEGLFRWLAELQLRWVGSYEEQLTFIGALVLVIGLANAATLLLPPASATETVSGDGSPVPCN